MIKQYYLLQNIKTIGNKNPLRIIDTLGASGLREAKRDFQTRNQFKKLLIKGDLSILEAKCFYQ